MVVNNTLSSSRASIVHFVVDYDCQPPDVEIENPSIPAKAAAALNAKTAAGCHLSLTQAVPLWLEPSVRIWPLTILISKISSDGTVY